MDLLLGERGFEERPVGLVAQNVLINLGRKVLDA